MRSFTLNNQYDSYSDFGIRILEPPAIPTTQRKVEDIEVEGRAGTLTREKGWADQRITVHCAITATQSNTAPQMFRSLRAVCAGTVASVGRIERLELSTNPGVFYTVKHIDFSHLTRLTGLWWDFTVTFTCQPFNYIIEAEPITLTTSGQVVNPCLVAAEPVITIYGSGTLTIAISSVTHTVKSPGGQVTIDTPRKICHVAGNIQTDALIGDFPILAPMSNPITLGPGITKVVIEPNWRNL